MDEQTIENLVRAQDEMLEALAELTDRVAALEAALRSTPAPPAQAPAKS